MNKIKEVMATSFVTIASVLLILCLPIAFIYQILMSVIILIFGNEKDGD